ncbi:glycosyl transferase [Metallosphaera yellowstonensis MK1]|uniref:Glycosyl transferase n=2 Tax=Metallosphaera TaxID=41980 RepID=H2C0I0_9CREN|nr:glycosyl transferase [Metallosphaera yellowstonensis MK1]
MFEHAGNVNLNLVTTFSSYSIQSGYFSRPRVILGEPFMIFCITLNKTHKAHSKIDFLFSTSMNLVELPLVTVVIPTLNSGKTIKKTLESLNVLEYKNMEIVVVDGKSTDDTITIIKQYYGERIRIVTEGKRGRGRAYNRGLLESRGKYVAFLDSDATIATPTWIFKAIKIMEEDERVAVVFTKVLAPKESTFMQKSIDTFLCKGFTTANGAVYRRDSALKVGGFNEKMNYMQEDELLYKLVRAGYSFSVNYDDIIYHYHRNTILSYIKQNMEAALGAKLYYRFTKNSWVLRDAFARIATVILMLVIISALIFLDKTIIAVSLLILGYLVLALKVNSETCKQYKHSKFVLMAPFFILLSMLGFSIGFFTKSGKEAEK